MRHLTVAVVLLALAATRASGGGIDFEIKAGVVHQVETDAAKIVFTVSGPCAIHLKDPDREDKANRVDTALKRCVITITKAAIPIMREQRSGHIIQFSSIGGRVGAMGRAPYSAAKWGVEGFSEVLATSDAS